MLAADPELSRRLAGIPTGALAVGVSLAGAICFLIKFLLTGNWGCAFTSAAFWTLMCGEWFKVSTGSYGRSAPESIAWAIAGVLFLMSVQVTWKTRLPKHLHTIHWLGAIALFGATVPVVLAACIARTGMSGNLVSIAKGLCLGADPLVVLETTAAASVALALVHCCLRQPAGGTPGIIAYFLMPCALSLTCRAIASWGAMDLGTMGHLLGMVSWVVLAAGFGIDAAIGQAEVSDRLDELTALHQVSWSVVGARDAQEMLQVFAGTLRSKLHAAVVSVYLATNGGEGLRVAAAYGPSGPCDNVGNQYPVVSTSRFPGFHTGHSAKAFTTGEAQIVRDVFVEVELVGWRIIGRDDGCAISLPLTDQEGTLGVLALYFSDHRQLTEPRIKLLTTLASAAAPAIRSANAPTAIRVLEGQGPDDELKQAA